MRRLTATAGVIAVVAASFAAIAGSADASRRCRNVITDVAQATQVTTYGGYACTSARALVRRYFAQVGRSAQTPTGCAQRRGTVDGCAIGNFVCTVRGARELRGRCSDGIRSVQFREVDFGPR